MGGVGTSASWRRQTRLFLNHAPPFSGRGRNSSIARISGEGHGTALVASSILAERRAPHPDPLPAKSGAREQISARGNRAYFPFSPCGRRWRGRSPRRLRGMHPQREPLTRLRFAKAPSPTGGEGKTSAPLAEAAE